MAQVPPGYAHGCGIASGTVQWCYSIFSTAFSMKTQILTVELKPAMTNPNGLLGQKLCHYLNQGRTFKDILIRATL